MNLAKIDLLTVSATLAGVSLSGLTISLPLCAGLLAFVYALWCCICIYEPKSFPRGIGGEVAEEIDEAVREGRKLDEHYRRLVFSYRDAISYLATAQSTVRPTFRNALWASVTAIVFFSFVVVRQLLPPYPYWFDVIVLVGVSGVVRQGKNKYEGG